MVSQSPVYVIYSPERNAYWGPKERGYTSLSQAGAYSPEDVVRIHLEGRLDGDEAIRLPEREGEGK